MINPFDEINKRIDEVSKKSVYVRCGTVTSISPFKCKLDGESTSDTYKKIKEYSPVIGDRVAFLVSNKKYFMIGAYE